MKKIFLFAGLLFYASLFAQNTIDNAFFDKVNFRGAMGTTDWTAGWSNFDPQNTSYSATQYTIEAGNLNNMALGSPFNAPSSFADASLASSFFTPVDYVGAFGQTDWTAGWANFDPQTTIYNAAGITIPSGNLATTTWTKNNVYLLNGFVYIPDGVTLTIEAGTVIRGDKTNKGTIIVEKGGKLVANGTAAEPIVFTSNQDAGSRNYGDWGGIILLGKAPVNPATTPTIEGGVGKSYGGSDAADNSGSLQYVRIEFPGILFSANNEINGLTLGGVGTGTTLDNIQVSYSGDDSFEWFGGTVNAKHLIAFRGWDDDFDTDFGYSGMVQFAVSLRDPAIADVSSSNCFESDNDGTGTTATPFTSAIFSNVSSFGPKVTTSTTINPLYASAMHIRRSSKLKIFNSIFAGWPKGLLVDGVNSQAYATAGDLKVKNVVMSGMGVNYAVGTTTTWDVAASNAWYNTTGFNNATFTDNTSLLVNNPFNLTAPDFKPFKTYMLNGFAYVPTGKTLTINPGVVVRGDKTNKGTIIVEMGGKLIANGTVSQPIVFTSNQAAGSRGYGDWGGIILLGKAPVNPATTPTIEGGVGKSYGGSDAADNSGSLQYLRIEFPGILFSANNEINGLTLGGVGSGTTLDNIQVSYSGDDSFEWFGGTVNAKHLIAFRGWDDDFDTDFGYSGMVQFAVSLRDPAIADVSSSNCFESDNDGTGTTAAPFTSAIFSNVSSFGPKVIASTTINPLYASAMHIRRSSKLKIYNSVFAGWPKGLLIDGVNSQAYATAGDLKVRNTIMSGMGVNYAVGSTTTWDVAAANAWFNNSDFINKTYTNNTDLQVASPFSLTSPNFLPTTTSVLNEKSYFMFNPASSYAYNMPIVATALVNGSTLSASSSKLMAYKNGACVGSATINTSNNQFALNVGSGVASDTELDLKLYDASSEMLYNLPTTFDFANGGSFGTSGTPEVLKATASLSIPVNTGYTWISFNVLPEDKSITNVLNYNVQNGDELFGQGVSANYDGGWDGIGFIEKNKMYVLKTSTVSPGSITVNNQPLVKNTPVTIKNGFTWLGYSLVNSGNINAAFSGMAINDGTQLFGQGVSDSYDGGWEGLTLNPGKGYKLKTTSAQSTFNYPGKLGSAARVSSVSAEIPTDWVTPTNMLNTANAYIKVYKSGALQATAGMTVAAFKGTECRGVKTLTGTRSYFALPIVSNLSTESGFTFKLYDPANGGVVYDMNETLDNFDCVNGYGTSTSTLPLTITSTSVDNSITSKMFNVYPNPVKDVFMLTLNSELSTNTKIDLYNLQGKHIQTIYSGIVNSNNTIEVKRDTNISSGMYLIKATIGGEQHITKVVLL